MPLSVLTIFAFFIGFLFGRYLEPIMSVWGNVREDLDRMAEGKSKPRNRKK